MLLTALIAGCSALDSPPGTEGNETSFPGSEIQLPPGANPAALPLLRQFLSAPSYRLIPLRYSTGPGGWEAYSTWPSYHFQYRGDGYYVHTPYNTAAYESAKTSDPSRSEDRRLYLVTLSNVGGNFWYFLLPTRPQVEWYQGLIADPAQNETYDAILSQMRPIREKYQLDDNEYAELIARFVQRSIPSRDQQLIERYPIETIGDLGGGRVDKSLLLAGLLSREGYAVSLIYFPNVNEMLVGIRGDHLANEYDGYIAVDPSTETFFGLDVGKAAREVPGSQYWADFTVIPVSDGKGFTAGIELRAIWDSWMLFANAGDARAYAQNLEFMVRNRDNRHLVAQYLAEWGLFG
ncbi:MAG: hypothetical protein LUQ64_00050 [Methanomicrobiales archaeon]|nr:hypothetical protein [Methanomicrobiales archaeon]